MVMNAIKPSLFQKPIRTVSVICARMAKPPAKASMMGLPVELRHNIFGHLFPKRNFGALMEWADLDLYYPARRSRRAGDCRHRECDPRKGYAQCRFTIKEVSHQLNDEVHDFMYAKKFSVRFQERMFFGDCASDMLVRAEEGAEYRSKVDWDDFDYTKAKQIKISVEPSTFPGFWDCVWSALTTLCEDHLVRFHCIRNIAINLWDMGRGSWCGMFEDYNGDEEVYEYEPIEARLADYSKTLNIFEEVVSKADTCIIRLPYWIENHNGFGPVVKKWKEIYGAQIAFIPWRSYIPRGLSIPEGEDVPERYGFGEISDE